MFDLKLGISIIYMKNINKKIKVEEHTFVTGITKIEDFYKHINERKNYHNAELVGISDLFVVYGKLDSFPMLGRYPNWGFSLKECKKLMKLPNELSYLSQNNEFDWYVITPIYYYEFSKKEKLSISFNSLIHVKNKSEVYDEAVIIANDFNFKKTMTELDYKDIDLNNLIFIGFEDIFQITGDIFKSESYDSSYEFIDDIKELEKILLTDEEIIDFFKVFKY